MRREIEGAAQFGSKMIAQDVSQQEVIAFLATPGTYGPECQHVDRIDTHISVVFLANERAFKLKRAVRLPYVDYSTLALRAALCEKEVRLGRRTAPKLYLGVVPITRSEAGELAIGATGTPVEWLVEMRRFDQDRLLDEVARRGELDAGLAARIGIAAAKLHASAAPRRDHGGASAMRWVVDENDAELSEAGEILTQSVRARLHQELSRALCEHGHLLHMRRRSGWVRECHGDLHLGNIFLSDDQPILFDGIEFNDELSCIDVLYDVAFLVMDLLHRDLPAQANTAVNAWLDRLPQYDALPLLPLFLSCRAAIRAKVEITATAVTADPAEVGRLERDANAYLDRALDLISPGRGAVIAIGGLSGSGKSTVARLLAPAIGRPPGALILRSDIARKRRFGVGPTERLPESAYSTPVSTAVYQELVRSARLVARSGYVAIVDAVFATEVLQQSIHDAASIDGVPFVGLWLDAPVEIMESRLAARGADASDADAAVLRQQQLRATVPSGWERIDASASIDRVAKAALGRAAERIGLPVRRIR